MCNEKIGDLSSIPMILYSSSLIHSYGDEHFYYTLRVFLGGWTVGIVVVHQIPKWDLHVVYFTPAWLTLTPLAIHGTHSPCAALIHVKLHHFSPVDYLFFFFTFMQGGVFHEKWWENGVHSLYDRSRLGACEYVPARSIMLVPNQGSPKYTAPRPALEHSDETNDLEFNFWWYPSAVEIAFIQCELLLKHVTLA